MTIIILWPEAIASYIKNQTDAEVTACCHSIDEVRQQRFTGTGYHHF
ncbi:MAG: hypothetical protein IPN49_16615 [Saprospiraceae bacterium]|nr:hypothetical protein [Saprospiraceae bacterium]